MDQAREDSWTEIRNLLLIAEVRNPSTSKNDRFLKRRRYQEAGVPLYWIVDDEAREVEVWTPGDLFPTIERERLIWQPVAGAEPVELRLEELLRAV